jgi:hypothetical protein
MNLQGAELAAAVTRPVLCPLFYRSLPFSSLSVNEPESHPLRLSIPAKYVYLANSFLIVCLFEPPAPPRVVQVFFCPHLPLPNPKPPHQAIYRPQAIFRWTSVRLERIFIKVFS